jgi:hypothetical protein
MKELKWENWFCQLSLHLGFPKLSLYTPPGEEEAYDVPVL